MKCVTTTGNVATAIPTKCYNRRRLRRMYLPVLPMMLLFVMLLLQSHFHSNHHLFVWGWTSKWIIPKHRTSSHSNSLYLNSNHYYYRPSWFHLSHILTATMYLPEDWVDDDANHEDRSTTSLTSSSSSSSSSLTIPSILKSPEWVAPLARIAAEYTKRLTPTIGHINVQQIEHVSITNVAPSHVDIEAIVCENDACVSLSVPVPFTQPCITTTTQQQQQQPQLFVHQSDKSFEDCVIRNIQELDTVQLQQQAITTTTTSTDVDISHIEYPSWWVHPIPSMEFTRECQSLLQILNEAEFQREITILVTKELYRMLNMDDDTNLNNTHILQVQSAIAVAVGPKGMVFRVHAMYEQQLEMVDVPIPFSSHGLLSIRDENDPLSLRNAVLFCIENVLP